MKKYSKTSTTYKIINGDGVYELRHNVWKKVFSFMKEEPKKDEEEVYEDLPD